MSRVRRLVGALAFAGVLAAPTAAFAADDASIDHSQYADGTLTMLVSVPGEKPVDLSSVKVSIGGKDVKAIAEEAATSDSVERTTVLAIDTSNSMRGPRINGAKQAAIAYLAAVPANVKVGIVTFDNDVVVRQQPSTDRNASLAVINHLSLKLNTKLYDGVKQAIATAGTGTGAHQVLLLSDGADNTGAPLAPAVSAVKKSGVRLDVVSLQTGGGAGPAALQALATAGKGAVIPADPKALTAAFAAEAAVLARQVVVSAPIPDTVAAQSANVSVSLAAGGTPYSANAYLAIRDRAIPTPDVPKAPHSAGTGFDIPTGAVYGGLAAIFLGVVGLVWAASSGRTPKLGVADQIAAYGSGADRQRALKKQSTPTDSLKDTAKAAAESMLASNKSLEARIANRLEGAGMNVKPAEWVLIHAGITVLVAIVGVLVGGGTNIPLMVMFLVLGLVGPWVYLTFKRARRLKSFHENLADTLQLMSGSLSAGLSLAQSLDTIVREGSEPMTGEFKRVIAETRLGVGLEDALQGVAERMDSKDFEWVIMAIRIQREVGGNLAELLLTVATTLREREYLRRQVRALSAEGRLSAYILGGLPPLFLLYLTATKPAYVHPLYSTTIGYLLLGTMLVMLAIGIFWMLKVAKVEV